MADAAMAIQDTIRFVLGRGHGPSMFVGPEKGDAITLAALLKRR